MQRQLHELTKEELIEVVQDYQEVVSDIESILNEYKDSPLRERLRAALYKERPGWRIHDKEGQQ